MLSNTSKQIVNKITVGSLRIELLIYIYKHFITILTDSTGTQHYFKIV